MFYLQHLSLNHHWVLILITWFQRQSHSDFCNLITFKLLLGCIGYILILKPLITYKIEFGGCTQYVTLNLVLS